MFKVVGDHMTSLHKEGALKILRPETAYCASTKNNHYTTLVSPETNYRSGAPGFVSYIYESFLLYAVTSCVPRQHRTLVN